ncbi:hypothetical protein GCM10008111_07790 [Alishewanella tabrizica]|uniref:Uncharacterized protein n=1 Tax=Alishewanella tabrizica TaxID=671278 RepID=A0ABQ2WIU5_9ALTE|nr:hypothetical protein GCM10008111_07790 [Alishewanella tabrizica]
MRANIGCTKNNKAALKKTTMGNNGKSALLRKKTLSVYNDFYQSKPDLLRISCTHP